MKIITNKRQKEIDEMMIKKLRFVAKATLDYSNRMIGKAEEVQYIIAMKSAEQVYYADDII